MGPRELARFVPLLEALASMHVGEGGLAQAPQKVVAGRNLKPAVQAKGNDHVATVVRAQRRNASSLKELARLCLVELHAKAKLHELVT